MFKWIMGVIILYLGVGFYMAYSSEYMPISKQIDVKTMSLKQPQFIIKKWSSCAGSCRNYSSDSSYGGGSSGGK